MKKKYTAEEALEAKRESKRKWIQNNKEKSKEIQKQYRQKNKEKRLEAQREYREKNRDKINANFRRYRKENGKEKVLQNYKNSKRKIEIKYREFMLDKKCERCPCNDARVLVWHHKDPSTKKYGVYEMVRRRYAWKNILAEINKCVCLCRNCHAIEHYPTEEEIQNLTETKKKYREFMKDKKCNRCPNSNIATLEWHHIDPSTKRECVSNMVAQHYSWETILMEIAKCECVCSSCHHIETRYSDNSNTIVNP